MFGSEAAFAAEPRPSNHARDNSRNLNRKARETRSLPDTHLVTAAYGNM
jgi:hypothetical protein